MFAETAPNVITRSIIGGDGSVTNASLPSPPAGPLLVAAEQMRGTVDQLTAYFLVERQLARGGPCAFIIPVFDGSGLYNLRFTDSSGRRCQPTGTRTSPARRRSARSPARISSQPRPQRGHLPARQDLVRPRGEGDRVLPVRMEYDTAFGVVKGYLAELRGRGINIQLMRRIGAPRL